MANTKRREEYIDRNGNMFMPMNVEGSSWETRFFTTTKMVTTAVIIFVLAVIIIYLGSVGAKPAAYLILISIWLFFTQYAVRYIIFEEKFYYKMYLQLKENEITTPAMFWSIASVKDTDDGAILTFKDARIAIIVKVDRDTITGKQKEFSEVHYDAISDFYKELVLCNLSFVQMNIMEQAGKDPRLAELSKLVYKSDNANIVKLMEMEVGHIKNITHTTLYESDYFIIFSKDTSRVDTIISDTMDCMYKLLDGAYSGYKILSSREVVELVKEEYGVNYFNSTNASLFLFENNVSQNIKPLEISGILWNDGNDQEFNVQERNKVRQLTSQVLRGQIDSTNMQLKKNVYRRKERRELGVDINKVGRSKKPKNKNNNSVKNTFNNNSQAVEVEQVQNINTVNNNNVTPNNIYDDGNNQQNTVQTHGYVAVDEEYIDL